MQEAPAFLNEIENTELLTGDSGQPITITEAQKRKIAIYSNRVALVIPGFRWTPEYKGIERLANIKNYFVEKFIDVSTADLDEIYAQVRANSNGSPTLELERQQEIRDLIDRAARENASDVTIRIVRGMTEIRTRIFGRMKDFDTRDEDAGRALIMAVFASASDQGTSSSMNSFMQGALTAKSGMLPPRVEMIRLQYSFTSENRGALVMRLKYSSPASEIDINHLGYNDQQIHDIAVMRRRTNGLYIFAGKVSSGKSTTLQRVLNRMFMEKNREITMYTIEEPVELDLPSAIQVPAKKNPDGTDGFEGAMRASLRSDPNIIVLGEVRSRDLAYLALQAVMTGHALWSTIHAGSALGILDRLTDFGVEPWKLADHTVVRGLIYQRLCAVICPKCRITMEQALKQRKIDLELAKRVSRVVKKHPRDLYMRGQGCSECKMGMVGRTVVAETVLTDSKMLEMYTTGHRRDVREYWLNSPEEGGLGGVPVLHHALSKVGAGICDITEVEEEVDLVEVYEREFMYLQPRLLADIEVLEKELAAKGGN